MDSWRGQRILRWIRPRCPSLHCLTNRTKRPTGAPKLPSSGWRLWKRCDRSFMGTTLPPDFKDFLKLLNSKSVRYLLIGGYAVAYHGYARATADMDLWIAIDPDNATKIVEAV